MEQRGVSCLLGEGKSFIAKLITDEEFYLLVDAMIHESFARDVEERDPLCTFSFCSRLHHLPPSRKIEGTYCAWLPFCFTFIYRFSATHEHVIFTEGERTLSEKCFITTRWKLFNQSALLRQVFHNLSRRYRYKWLLKIIRWKCCSFLPGDITVIYDAFKFSPVGSSLEGAECILLRKYIILRRICQKSKQLMHDGVNSWYTKRITKGRNKRRKGTVPNERIKLETVQTRVAH